MIGTRWVAALTIAATALLAGCSDDPRTVSVAASAGQVTLADGERLRVDLGAYNSSIGDSWQLTAPPDPAVLADHGEHLDSDCAEGMVGCGGTLSWRFAAAGPGRTTIEFTYCYRSRVPDCDPGPGRGPAGPVTLTVTVGP